MVGLLEALQTKRGAQAYAKKHRGVWVIIYCSEDILTKEEIEDLGQWIVGRADEYLFFKTNMVQTLISFTKPLSIGKTGMLLS